MGKKEKQRQVTQGFTDSEDDDDGENKSLASTFKKGNKVSTQCPAHVAVVVQLALDACSSASGLRGGR